jgi:hypothetical protein
MHPNYGLLSFKCAAARKTDESGQRLSGVHWIQHEAFEAGRHPNRVFRCPVGNTITTATPFSADVD